MDLAGDTFQTFRSVIDRIHRGHHCQQHLRGADVGSRLVAANVLLAGLQGKSVSGLALGVDGNTDQATRHFAFQRVFASHETRMRATETERHTEAL